MQRVSAECLPFQHFREDRVVNTSSVHPEARDRFSLAVHFSRTWSFAIVASDSAEADNSVQSTFRRSKMASLNVVLILRWTCELVGPPLWSSVHSSWSRTEATEFLVSTSATEKKICGCLLSWKSSCELQGMHGLQRATEEDIATSSFEIIRSSPTNQTTYGTHSTRSNHQIKFLRSHIYTAKATHKPTSSV
jgi:hypothetical protein